MNNGTSKTYPKILIVEDDKAFLWILSQSFTSTGFSVVSALDGEEGLKITEQEKPDLILLDIQMPKMDGIEMAKRLRAKGINSKIIFLTNYGDENHISQAMEVNKDTDYIIKSDMHVDQVVARVKEKLGS